MRKWFLAVVVGDFLCVDISDAMGESEGRIETISSDPYRTNFRIAMVDGKCIFCDVNARAKRSNENIHREVRASCFTCFPLGHTTQ